MASNSGCLTHINLAAGLRGGERQTLLLIEQLAERGWRQRLVTRPNAPLARALPESLQGTVDVRTGANVVAAARACTASAIVHAHDGRAVYAAALAGWYYRAQTVLTRRVMNPLRRGWAQRLAYGRAHAVVAISTAVAEAITTSLPFVKPVIIPSAYQPPQPPTGYADTLRQQWGERFVVGNVAALEDDSKGQSCLVALARAVPDVHVVLVGSGRDEAPLRAAASGLTNVEFAGQSDDVDAYLRAFDLFAFPSLREGFGSVLLDAMRHGLAVVAKKTGGIVDIVESGKTGYLVAANDNDGFIAAVQDLQHDAVRRREFGAAAQQRVERFSAAIMADRYEALYRAM
ncbi:MAG: glycosyltransferase family 4 protein [Pseudomonadota bacterium]